MKDDPWDWTKQSMQAPPPLQTNNTLNVPASGQTQAPPPVQGPPGFGQMAGNILVARGVNQGIDESFKAGEKYFNKAPHDPNKVIIEDRVGTAPSSEAPSRSVANIDTATSAAAGSSVANNVLPLANQAVSTEGVDMAFQAADQAQLMNQGLSATQAASTVAPLSEAAALDAAATTGANAAAASSVAAGAGTSAVVGGAGAGAAVGTGAAGAGVGAAAAPLAMTPIGWGIGALLLAKQMKWI